MDVSVITSRGILVKEITDPGNRRCFGNSCISMLHYSAMICDQYTEGFTINYFIDILSVTVIIYHPRYGKIN